MKKDCLLDVRAVMTPKDVNTCLCHAFTVSDAYEKLEITYDYEPKALEDRELSRMLIEAGLDNYAPGEWRNAYGTWEDYLPVVTLATISVDDAEGRYRGCAHRHPNHQYHEIGESDATYGFEPGPIMPGVWRALVQVHAVATETCTYSIRIEGVRKA